MTHRLDTADEAYDRMMRQVPRHGRQAPPPTLMQMSRERVALERVEDELAREMRHATTQDRMSRTRLSDHRPGTRDPLP